MFRGSGESCYDFVSSFHRVLEHSLWWSKEGIKIFLSTSCRADLQFRQCRRSKSILRLLEIGSDQPCKTKVVDHVITFARSLDSHFFHGVFCEISPCEDCCPVLVLCFLNQFVQYMFTVVLRDLRGLI
jgi:hypothetical protein